MQKKRSVWLITCCPLAHTSQPYLYNTILISLQLFKLTPTSLQLNLWLIWTLPHDLCLFELLTWSYSDSNSTWSPPQLNFQLNRIPHPWTLLRSVLAHPGLDSALLELKVLIPFWTQTPSQFGLVSSIFFLNSSGQLTRVTFTLSAYPIGLLESCQNSLFELHLSALPDHINAYPALYVHTQLNYLSWFFSRLDFYLPDLIWSYPAELPYPTPLLIRLLLTRPYIVLPSRITLPDSSPNQTSTYLALHVLTRLNYLTRSLPDRTSANPTVPSYLTWFSYLAK
jgi:hypothetical protein